MEKTKYKTAVIMLAFIMMFSFFPIDVSAYSIAENETEVSEKSSMVSEDSLQSADANAENNAEQQSGGSEDISQEAASVTGGETADEIKADENSEKQDAAAKTEKDNTDKEKRVKASNALRAVQDGVITNIEALLQDGSGPVNDITQWQVFRIKADFALPDSVKSGDTTTIKLPDKLRFNQTVPFEIKDANGSVVANAVVNGAEKTITLTYTDYAENHSDVTGNFFFYVRMDRSKVDDEEDIPLDFIVNNQVISAGSVHFVGYPTPTGATVAKSGTQESTATGTRAFFNVNINTRHTELKDVTVVDTVKSEGIRINQSTLVIKKGTWVAVKGDWQLQNMSVVTDQFNIEWNDDVGFTVALGDIGPDEGYQITYYIISDYELLDGETVDNNVILHSANAGDAGYDARIIWTVAGGSAEGYVFEIKIHKQSEDGSPLAGAEFNVVRKANNAVVGTITTDAEGNGSLSGLLKTDYQLVETSAPDGFVPLDDPIDVLASEFGTDKTVLKTITNKAATTEISGSKTWEDNDDQDGARPESITINLLADGEIKESKTVTASDNWSWNFTDLPKFSNGSEISYSITEDAVTDYSTEYNGYDVTNTHTPGKTSISVTKAWDDNNDQDGIRPQSIIVKLLADGNDTGKTKELNAGNNWTDSFTDLDEYSNGRKIAYTIEEAAVEGYTSEVTGDAQIGFIITNTHTPEVTEVSGSKTWKDNDDQDGARPESITINLLVDGHIKESKTVTAADNWSWSFTDLPKFSSGREISYSITEDAVTDYSTEYDGFDVTNTHAPGRTSISVTKSWNDNNDQDGIRPNWVTVKLLADGKETGSFVKLKESNGWTASFTDLEKYDNGKLIDYTVSETDVYGYTAKISGNADEGYAITNTHNPEKTKAANTPSKTGRPKTGDETQIVLYLGILAAAGAAILIMTILRRRKDNE